MIRYSNSLINLWNKKIIYAPNGFGKTTNARKLYNDTASDFLPLLFTRKEIENLLSFDNSKIFLGKTANQAKNNDKLKKEFLDKNDNIKDFFKKYYKSKSISKLNKISFFIKYFNIKKFDDINSFCKIETDSVAFYDLDVAIKIDNILNYDIYNDVLFLLDNENQIKEVANDELLTCVNEEIINSLNCLFDYVKKIKSNQCPLCGHVYKEYDNLVDAINVKISSYKVEDEDNLYLKLLEVFRNIVKTFSDLSFANILFTKSYNSSTLTEMLDVIKNYKKICEKTIDTLCVYVCKIKLESYELGTIIRNFNLNKADIDKEKSNIKQIKSFQNFILNELNKIISVDSNVEFVPLSGDLTIKIKTEDGDNLDLYNILSESEVKRLSLIVLKGMIKYGKYNLLILDDPIDSYDDYYLYIVCEYIKNILSIKKITNWYLLTNNYTALCCLSKILKCDSIIYYYSPDCLLNGNFVIDNFTSDYREIEQGSKSEIQLLYDFLKNKLDADPNLSFLAFIVTLRNIKQLVLNNYAYLKLYKHKKFDNNYMSDVKRIIEHFYMHYDNIIDSNFNINSNTLTIGNVFDLFERLCKPNRAIETIFKQNNNYIEHFRQMLISRNFSSFKGSKFINLIFAKICLVSYFKYKYEKMLINKLIIKYKYSNNDILTIINTNSLGEKIGVAEQLSKKKYLSSLNFINEYKLVYENNNLLFNLFDHALEYMFPPYIAANLKDIKKFKDDIDTINLKYK